MITRKEFLQGIPAILSTSFLVALVNACSPGGVVLRASSQEGKVIIPTASLPPSGDTGTYTRVYIDNQTNPVFVYRDAKGSLTAVLGTCTHKGCGVKKTPSGFECPCHGSEYSLHGEVTRGPASQSLRTYAVLENRETAEFEYGEGQ